MYVIYIRNPHIIKVLIKASKTDPFRRGVEVFIWKDGQHAFLAERGRDKGMLFRLEDRRRLISERFVNRVRSVLKSAGIDYKQYSSHSFRIGAATAAG